MRRAHRNWLLAGLLIVTSAVTIGFTLAETPRFPEASSTSTSAALPGTCPVLATDEGTRYVVDPAKLVECGPGQDGIPSIDRPHFVSVEEADTWIEDSGLVLALTYKGETRAYPLLVLVWHEIVNDDIAGDPVLITYCPLGGSGMAYLRELDGSPVLFGTSGELFNSNLVMYDRASGTYWTQMEGLAIVGEHAGEQLEPLDAQLVTWGRWKLLHPDALVLDKETGFDRPYGREPYGTYNEDHYIWFPVENRDDRLHPKTRIVGLEINGIAVAYRACDLDQTGVIEDRVSGIRIRMTRDPDGEIHAVCPTTGSSFEVHQSFWFTWAAFHPSTQLYQASTSP